MLLNKSLWQWLKRRAHRFDGDRAAHLFMRAARPIFFTLMTAMFIIGWNNPEQMDIFLKALASAPDWIADIATILILGLAVEKGISRPIKEVLTSIKGK